MLGIKFFYLAGLMEMSLKSFITQDDKKVINRVLFETEDFKKQEIICIVGIKFYTPNYTKFTKKNQRILVQLLETCLILSASLVSYTTLQKK